MNKFKEKITLNPVLTFLILILATIVLSGFFHLIGFEATYNKIDLTTGEYVATSESVESLMNLSGIKYIFTSTVSNFTAFTPLSTLIIILIGIGIMEKSGFLKTTFTILTKFCKRYTITFWLVLLSVAFSIMGDIGYAVMIPLAALMFSYGRRNPILGIVAVYAGLTCGTGLSMFLTAIDSEMLSYTLANAHNIDPTYTLSTMCFLFIMTVAVILVSVIITTIVEKYSASRVEKYEYKDDKKELRLGMKTWLSIVLFSLFGQIAWTMENMFFNVFIEETFNAGGNDISLMVSASAVAATLTTLFMGALSDKLGKRKVFICFGYLLWCYCGLYCC